MFRTITILLLAAVALPANDEYFDAARRGDLAQVKAALDKGVPVDTPWRYGQTALMMAAGRGHVEVVKLLLERGAKADVKDTFYGMTALSAAADKNSVEIIGMLLDKGASGADDLLTSSARRGKVALVKALVARGGLKPETMTKALGVAEAEKHSEVVTVLKAAGAQPRAVVAVDASVLASYAGTYQGQGGDVQVEVREGKLFVLTQGQTFELVAVDSKSFEIPKHPNTKVSFTAEGMELNQGGSPQKLPRKQEASK